MRSVIKSKQLFVLSILVFVYVGVAFLAPILLKNGYVNIATPIYEVYEKFCHQRVERSIFLFGEKTFYTVRDLKEDDYIPDSSESDLYPEYYGHGFNGNDDIGFKVAICIRDVAMYLSFAFVLLFLSITGVRMFSWNIVWILIFPIFLDIGIQMIIEKLRLGGIYLDYINSILKRIITGGLAGIGSAFALSNIVIKSLTNDSKKGDNQE